MLRSFFNIRSSTSLTPVEKKKRPYINAPTKFLVSRLWFHARRGGVYFEDQGFNEEFERFKSLCRKTPSIIPYILERIHANHSDPGFNAKQMSVLLAAVFFRSSSTYGAIQHLIAQLHNIGMHEDAAIINANANNETGDKKNRPHPSLLYEFLYRMSEMLPGVVGLQSPGDYQLLREIMRIRRDDPNFFKNNSSQNLDSLIQEFNERVGQDAVFRLPQTAANFAFSGGSMYVVQALIQRSADLADLLPPELWDYHNEVLKVTQGLDESGMHLPGSHIVNDRIKITICVFELAIRESSSVDNFEQGEFSYIGTYGRLAEAYAGYAYNPDAVHHNPALVMNSVKILKAWAKAHNDEKTGRRLGWKGSAEAGHAQDAINLAIKTTRLLSVEQYTRVLAAVNYLMEERLRLWDCTLKALEGLEMSGPKIPPKMEKKFTVSERLREFIPGLR